MRNYLTNRYYFLSQHSALDSAHFPCSMHFRLFILILIFYSFAVIICPKLIDFQNYFTDLSVVDWLLFMGLVLVTYL